MEKTRRGVYLDIKESDYVVNLYNYEFYFSSELYKNKFIKEYDNYIKTESHKFAQKYGVTINFALIFLLSLYTKIEKRGFYVKFKGIEISRFSLFFGDIR